MSSLLDKLDAAIAQAPKNSRIYGALWKQGVVGSTEFARIEALPRRVLDLEQVPDLTPVYRTAEFCEGGCELCAEGPARLWPVQSAALLEAEATGGLFGAIPVGEGKTLISLLLPDALRARRAGLLVPADVRDQLVETDIPRLSRHFRLPLDRLTIISYTELSNLGAHEVPAAEFEVWVGKGWRVLEGAEPEVPGQIPIVERDPLDLLALDVVIADEGHALRHRKSARTMRWEKAHRRDRHRFTPLSGTMTTDSVLDYAHLLGAALRDGSPVPAGFREQQEWAEAIDVNAEEPRPPGALLRFCSAEDRAAAEAGTMAPVQAARAGFAARLCETPGVVVVEAKDCGAELEVRRVTIPVPGIVVEHLRELDRTWSIAGEEIDEAARLAAVARQLSQGFYYVWDWPGGIVDHEWLEARAAWNKAVRGVIARKLDGMDTPMLIYNAASRGALARVTPEWRAWAAVHERPAPPHKPVWLSDFVVRAAADWAAPRTSGLVWYEHDAVGEALGQKGLPVFGAGTSAALVRLASIRTDVWKPGVIACSIFAHHRGKNLQHRWCENLVLCWPSNGTISEQMIGRTHRPGQKAPRVTFERLGHTRALEGAFEDALADARYVRETYKTTQKLLKAKMTI